MNTVDLDELRQRAEERVHAKRQFSLHVVVFGVCIALLWVLWALTLPESEAIGFFPVLMTIGWGFALGVHGLATLQKLHIDDVVNEDDVIKEMAKEMRLRGIDPSLAISGYVDEKRKRSPDKPKHVESVMRLSDDGELIEVDPAEQDRSSINHRSPNGHR
jgi:hypothetical protein